VDEASGHIDAAALERSLQGLRTTIEGAGLEQSLGAALEAASVLFDVSGIGLMVIDENRALRYVAATDEVGRALEEVQERDGHGPCIDALVFDKVVQSRDLVEDERWPEIRSGVREGSVRAVLGVPVHVAGETVGALDGYLDRPYEWDAGHVKALQAYADLLGSVLASAVQARRRGELVDQLQHALHSRVVIERAVGMLMGREGIDAVAAFDRLRREARNRRERVAELAERVLAGLPLER
jgi:GAF domain-containing protein